MCSTNELPSGGLTRTVWSRGYLFAVFASLMAPFGGFFASGFKRAFNIKDFGSSIPGHGGMTDRMDCQVRPLASSLPLSLETVFFLSF